MVEGSDESGIDKSIGQRPGLLQPGGAQTRLAHRWSPMSSLKRSVRLTCTCHSVCQNTFADAHLDQ